MKNIINIKQEGENTAQKANLLSQNVWKPQNNVCETEQARTMDNCFKTEK